MRGAQGYDVPVSLHIELSASHCDLEIVYFRLALKGLYACDKSRLGLHSDKTAPISDHHFLTVATLHHQVSAQSMAADWENEQATFTRRSDITTQRYSQADVTNKSTWQRDTARQRPHGSLSQRSNGMPRECGKSYSVRR